MKNSASWKNPNLKFPVILFKLFTRISHFAQQFGSSSYRLSVYQLHPAQFLELLTVNTLNPGSPGCLKPRRKFGVVGIAVV